jgi:choline-glycine betaine transporter
MDENTLVESETVDDAELAKKQARKQRWIMVGIIAGIIVVLAAIAAAIFGLTRSAEVTSNIRDIFIIFMAFESLIIGAALVILVIQVASLINLLQNEVKPILQATTDTVNTLRGTTEFLSENLVEPVIKLNSYLAGLRKIFDIFNLKK